MAKFLIIPAAGRGDRLGRSEPKALVLLCGRPLLSWTLEALAEIEFDDVVIAAPPDRIAEFERFAGKRARVVRGGETRSASVRASFSALSASERDTICVHDAARPFVTARETAEVLRAAQETGAAIAATPIVDTVKKVEEGRVLETIDRARLYSAGTPQAFRRDLLARALESGREATDEAALCESVGIPVAVVRVSRLGFKITTPEDLEVAEAIAARRGR